MLNKGNEILNITVEIGAGKKDHIVIHEHDVPSAISRNFASKHQLSAKLENALTKSILELISDLNQDQQFLSSTASAQVDPVVFDYKNNGEKLYAKGLQYKEENNAKNQIIKNKLERQSSSQATFKPAVNKAFKKSAKNLIQKPRINESLNINKDFIDDECTFTPKINTRSKLIRNNSSRRTQELYEYGKERKNRIEELNLKARMTEFPFKPITNHKGHILDAQSSIERLTNSKSNYMENIENLRKKYESSNDPKTGQRLFQPKLMTGNKSSRNGESVWDSLYNNSKKPQLIEEFPFKPVILASKQKSDKIILKAKVERYSEIFDQLNPDINRLVYFKNIKENQVDPLVFKTLQPLIKELEAADLALNFEDFANSMENLLKILTTVEKDALMARPKKKQEPEKAQGKRSASSCDFNALYLRHLERKQLSAAKLEIEREKKKILELKDCTFHPQTNKLYK